QKRRVADECDDGGRPFECRERSRRDLETRWPGRAPLEQHTRNGRKRLRGETGRIEEVRPVEVIALRKCLRHGSAASAVSTFYARPRRSAQSAPEIWRRRMAAGSTP